MGQAAVKCMIESNLFSLDHFFNMGSLFHYFRKSFTHDITDCSRDLIQKRFVHAQDTAEARCPTQDPAQNIPASFVGRQGTISDGKTKHADVIGNHLVSNRIIQAGRAGN